MNSGFITWSPGHLRHFISELNIKICSLIIVVGFLTLEIVFIVLIATNQRVVAAKRQQRGLVAVTIRGSVLFYSSAI